MAFVTFDRFMFCLLVAAGKRGGFSHRQTDSAPPQWYMVKNFFVDNRFHSYILIELGYVRRQKNDLRLLPNQHKKAIDWQTDPQYQGCLPSTAFITEYSSFIRKSLIRLPNSLMRDTAFWGFMLQILVGAVWVLPSVFEQFSARFSGKKKTSQTQCLRGFSLFLIKKYVRDWLSLRAKQYRFTYFIYFSKNAENTIKSAIQSKCSCCKFQVLS